MRNLSVDLAIAVAITSVFAFALSAQLASGAARESIASRYTVTTSPYLPIKTVEPVLF
jgi:hypothetical protein